MTVNKVSSDGTTKQIPNFPAMDSIRCIVNKRPDGGAVVAFKVDPEIMKRHMSRAGQLPLDQYFWENILHRAVTDSVY